MHEPFLDTHDDPCFVELEMAPFIPKVSSDTIRLADLRPLMLMGILRKLWSSHIGGKIMTALHKHKILDNAHHGFIAGRGTSTATLLHVNHSEDVEEKTAVSNRTSYDLSKAFDSVLKAGSLWSQQ